MSPLTNIAVDARNFEVARMAARHLSADSISPAGTGLEAANTRHQAGSDAAGWIDDRVNILQGLVDQIMGNGIEMRPSER
jgi:hypothetical protein